MSDICEIDALQQARTDSAQAKALARERDAFAAELRERGLQSGEQVMLFMRAGWARQVALAATRQCDALPVVCEPRFGEHCIGSTLPPLVARVIVVDDLLLPALEAAHGHVHGEHIYCVRRELPPGLRRSAGLDTLPAGTIDFNQALRLRGAEPGRQAASDNTWST